MSQCKQLANLFAEPVVRKKIKRNDYFEQQITIVDSGKCLKVLGGLPCEITLFLQFFICQDEFAKFNFSFAPSRRLNSRYCCKSRGTEHPNR